MQRLSVAGTQRTQVQIFPYLNSCGALSERMEQHRFKTVVSLNTFAFTLCWAEMILCKGEPAWSAENVELSVDRALPRTLRA